MLRPCTRLQYGQSSPPKSVCRQTKAVLEQDAGDWRSPRGAVGGWVGLLAFGRNWESDRGTLSAQWGATAEQWRLTWHRWALANLEDGVQGLMIRGATPELEKIVLPLPVEAGGGPALWRSVAAAWRDVGDAAVTTTRLLIRGAVPKLLFKELAKRWGDRRLTKAMRARAGIRLQERVSAVLLEHSAAWLAWRREHAQESQEISSDWRRKHRSLAIRVEACKGQTASAMLSEDDRDDGLLPTLRLECAKAAPGAPGPKAQGVADTESQGAQSTIPNERWVLNRLPE